MTDINAPCVQYTLCAHRFGLTVQAILKDLVNHHNDKVTIDEGKKILFTNSQLQKERYQCYNWEYRASNQNIPETSYRQLNNMTNITIWQHMLSSPSKTHHHHHHPLRTSSTPANSSKTTYSPSAKTRSPWPKYTTTRS